MQQGLILVRSNAELEAEERHAIEEDQRAEQLRTQQVETSLASYIRKKWELAKRHKEPIEQRMIASLRQIEGRYSEAKEREIADQGLPLIYMRLTAVKGRAAKSWIRDVLMPAGDKPWTLKATPMPSLQPEMEQAIAQRVQHDAQEFMMATGQAVTPGMMMDVAKRLEKEVLAAQREEADTRVDRMADTIEDQLTEGGWPRHFEDVISDVVDFPAAILKGPVVRKRKKLAWDPSSGVVVDAALEPEVERVDPFNFYPLPGVTEPDEGDVIEYHEYTAGEMYDLIGLPGYEESEIRAAIKDYGDGYRDFQRGTLASEQMRARGEHVGAHNEDEHIGAIEFWGEIRGNLLLDWGMTAEEVPDPDESYDVMAVLVGTHVICVRFNPDPLGRKPYSKSSFEEVPGSFWGKGVPELIEDCQNVCNASARSLVANMGISSGPQVAVNMQSIPPGQDVTNIFPWKIWQLDFTKTGAGSRPPIEFFQPSPMTEQLLKVFDHFSRLADEYSGIPAYTYGSSSNMGGAARTASGLSMLMNAASKAIKNVIRHVDTGVIAPTIERFYVWNMLYNDDDSIKGDAQVVARGALSLVAKEQNQMRLQELLVQSANPVDMQIMGMDGRAALWRQALHGVDVGSDDVIPGKEELQQQLMMAQQAQQQAAQQSGPREAGPDGQPLGGQQ